MTKLGGSLYHGWNDFPFCESNPMNAIRTTQNVSGPTLTIAMPAEFEGKQVEVEVRVIGDAEPWGEGVKRCAGALADDTE